MNPMSPRFVAALILALFLSLPAAHAADLTADELIEKVTATEFPENMTATVKMILQDRDGGERLREFKMKRRGKGDEGEALIRFVSPPEVEGTAFLITKKKDKDSEIYMFIPELKRTRRISGSESNRSFVGSDFSYSDIQLSHFDKGTHKIVRSEKIDGVECHLLESTMPPSDEEPYDRIEAWVRKDNYLPAKVLFYSGSDEPKKQLTILQFKTIEGQLVVTESVMETLKKNHKTRLILQDLKLNVPFKAAEFSRRALEHG